MYPSKPNTAADASSKEAEASKLTTPSSASDERHGPSSYSAYQSSSPSAPLLPSSPYTSPAPNMEPPPYSSVVPAQDANDWKNRSSSFSGGNNLRPYPPSSPYINGSKSTSGLDNQAPYPTGGHSPYGVTPAQAPYPTGPGSAPEIASSAPYPTGPGLGSGITSQPPYSTGSGYMPGPASQAPYPMGSMPMPMSGPVDPERRIGFTAPVTTEPKPTDPGYPGGGWGQGPHVIQPATQIINGYQGNQQGLIYPAVSGENQYMQTSQYVPNQYAQQQPNTIYIVQKAPERNNDSDDCCFWACCLASCYCLCECIKVCADPDS